MRITVCVKRVAGDLFDVVPQLTSEITRRGQEG